MKTMKLIALSIMPAIMLLNPLPAQPQEVNLDNQDISVKTPVLLASSRIVDTNNEAKPFRLNLIHPETLKISDSASNVLVQSDRVMFVVNAETPEVDRALALAGTIAQTPVNDSGTRWLQFLSMAVTHKIVAEISYQIRVGKSSRFTSGFVYRVRPTDDSYHADMAANFAYSLNF